MPMSVRKYTNKRVIVLKSEEIRMIEDEWWGRFNKNYNINTNKVG